MPPFEERAKQVLAHIRSAFAEVFLAMDVDPTRPQEMARRFDLNKNLTWKISKIVREHDPALAYPHIPGAAGLAILLDSLKKAGAPVQALMDLKKALSDLDDLIEVHAGDRETFEMMIGNLARSTDGQQQAEALRKLSFRGNSAIWGVQAKVQICTNFIAPGADSRMVDLAWLSGLIDFWRLRRDATWAMAAARKTADDGTPLPVGEILAIDSRYDDAHAVPLMGDFCSQPLPDVRAEVDRDGVTRYVLGKGPVGGTATTTCVIGLYGRDFVRRFRAPNDTLGEHFARLYTPVETLIHDLFVHQDLTYAMAPQMLLYSQMPGGPIFPAAPRDRGLIPVYDPVIGLGEGLSSVVTPEFPQYLRMIRTVFERLNWKAEEFRVFRFRLRYPPIPTVALWRYELPEKP
jgi:hypothetical protein